MHFHCFSFGGSTLRRFAGTREMEFGSASQGLYYGYSGNTFIIATSILVPFPGFFQPPRAQATSDNYS